MNTSKAECSGNRSWWIISFNDLLKYSLKNEEKCSLPDTADECLQQYSQTDRYNKVNNESVCMILQGGWHAIRINSRQVGQKRCLFYFVSPLSPRSPIEQFHSQFNGSPPQWRIYYTCMYKPTKLYTYNHKSHWILIIAGNLGNLYSRSFCPLLLRNYTHEKYMFIWSLISSHASYILFGPSGLLTD